MNINVEYFHTPNELGEMMGRNGSDKGNKNNTAYHNYTDLYFALFAPIRNESVRIFELGLGTNNTSIPSNMGVNGTPGASHRAWKEFFPKGSIFGADIDRNILFEEARLKTFYCDQTDPVAISELWKIPELHENFDVIIDDGLHTYHANKCFFENSIHKLKVGGVYIIEDILNNNLANILELIEKWRTPFLSFRLVALSHARNSIDNNVLIVQKIN